MLSGLPMAKDYESAPVLVAKNLFRWLHKPSGCWHRLKIASNAKEHYFLDNEASWMERLGEFGLVCSYSLNDVGYYRLLITDYLAGSTLTTLLRQQGSRFENYESVIVQLYDILQGYHRQGIVHGDIKPNNLIFDGRDVLLIDFANAGWAGRPIRDRPYRGYSPSYSLPSLQRGDGIVSPLMDWFGYLMVVRLLLGGDRPQLDWRDPNAASEYFHPWLAKSPLAESQRTFLESILLQLDHCN